MTVYFVDTDQDNITTYPNLPNLFSTCNLLKPETCRIVMSEEFMNKVDFNHGPNSSIDIMSIHGIEAILDPNPITDCWIYYSERQEMDGASIGKAHNKLKGFLGRYKEALISTALDNPFKKYTDDLAYTLKSKNDAYGNSFDKSLDADGLLVAKIRMGDKLNRISHLIKNDESTENNESLFDNLKDLAGYAVLTWKYLKEHES